MSVNIKLMSKGFYDFKYLLVAICEITNFVLAIPDKSRATQNVAVAIIHRDLCILTHETPNSR